MRETPIQDKRILIPGVAGFIDSALVGRLAEHNCIAVYDNLSRDLFRDEPYCNYPNLTSGRGECAER